MGVVVVRKAIDFLLNPKVKAIFLAQVCSTVKPTKGAPYIFLLVPEKGQLHFNLVLDLESE